MSAAEPATVPKDAVTDPASRCGVPASQEQTATARPRPVATGMPDRRPIDPFSAP